jgi:hypothetical protein
VTALGELVREGDGAVVGLGGLVVATEPGEELGAGGPRGLEAAGALGVGVEQGKALPRLGATAARERCSSSRVAQSVQPVSRRAQCTACTAASSW